MDEPLWNRRLTRRALRVAALALLMVACADSDSGLLAPLSSPQTADIPSGANLRITVGNHQVARPGAVLPQNLRVKLTTPDGQGIPNVDVRWSVAVGNGTLLQQTSRTNSNGVATNAWTLGWGSVVQTVKARVTGIDSVTFSARADTSGYTFRYRAPGGSAGTPDSAHTAIVEVRDGSGAVVVGATGTFAVVSGGGSINRIKLQTNSGGRSSTIWTLGGTGEQRLRATIGALGSRDLVLQLPPCPSIVSFGALPDDDVDDTPAIQQALENPDRCAFVPTGVFRVGLPLRIETTGFTLRGQGSGAILRYDNSINLRANYPGRTGSLNILASDVLIERVTFDQNFRGSGLADGATPVAASIAVGDADLGTYRNIIVRSCLFHDYYGDAVQGRDVYVYDVRVENNLFRSAYVVSGWTTAGPGGEQAVSFDLGARIDVIGNRIEGALDDAIAFHLEVSDVTVANNTITTTGGRILLNGTANAVVSENHITYIQDGATAIIVSREPVTDPNRVHLVTRSHHILITNNTVTVNAGVIARGGLIYVFSGDSVQVSNNILHRTDRGGSGIRLSDREHEGELYGNVGIVMNNNLITNSAIGVAIHATDRAINRDIVVRNNTMLDCDVGVVDRLGPPNVELIENTGNCTVAVD